MSSISETGASQSIGKARITRTKIPTKANQKLIEKDVQSLTDRFVPRSEENLPSSGTDGVQSKKLTADMAKDLASRYDVNNMDRNEFNKLLKELRDAGVITSQEFGVGYGGAEPYTAPETGDGALVPPGAENKNDMSWPFGKQKADFTALLKSYAQYCGNFSGSGAVSDVAQAYNKSLSSTYSHLYNVFKQIEAAKAE